MDEKNYNTDYAYVVPASDARTCYCARCRSRGLLGPALLVTLGLLFLVSEFHVASFGRTWPIVLIVIGLVKVLAGNADSTGHIDVNAPPPPPPTVAAQPGAAQNSEPGQVDHV